MVWGILSGPWVVRGMVGVDVGVSDAASVETVMADETRFELSGPLAGSSSSRVMGLEVV